MPSPRYERVLLKLRTEAESYRKYIFNESKYISYLKINLIKIRKLKFIRIFNHFIKTEIFLKNSIDKIRVRYYNTDTNKERTD